MCGAFPVVYSTILSAFYVPFLLMLTGLIVRDVVFGRRDKAQRLPWLWAAAVIASLIAALMRGLAFVFVYSMATNLRLLTH